MTTRKAGKPANRRDVSTSSKTPANSPKYTAYDTYLLSLAPSGRKAVASLLQTCSRLLDHNLTAEKYPWHELTFAEVSMVRAELLTRDYAVASVNLALSALRGLGEIAFNMGLMNAENVARIRAVKRVKGNARRQGRSLSRAEVKALLHAAKQHPCTAKRTRDQALLLVACGAGLRASELVSLQINDFVAATGLLQVREGKGRKFRAVHLAKPIIAALNAWIRNRGQSSGALFARVSRGGQPAIAMMTKAGLAAVLEDLRLKAGLDPFTPHDMRRTFITHLLAEGADINTVRQLAGHSDIATTARYDCRGMEAKIFASKTFSCW